jgi:hypothetical protein
MLPFGSAASLVELRRKREEIKEQAAEMSAEEKAMFGRKLGVLGRLLDDLWKPISPYLRKPTFHKALPIAYVRTIASESKELTFGDEVRLAMEAADGMIETMNLSYDRFAPPAEVKGGLGQGEFQNPPALSDLEPMKQFVQGRAVGGTSLTSVSQAVNDVHGGKGKATGSYQYRSQAILHCSAGVAATGTGCSIFFVRESLKVKIIGIGRHVDATSYTLAWTTSDWTPGKTLRLT